MSVRSCGSLVEPSRLSGMHSSSKIFKFQGARMREPVAVIFAEPEGQRAKVSILSQAEERQKIQRMKHR